MMRVMLLLISLLPACLSLLELMVWASHPQFCLSGRTHSCPSDPKALLEGACRGLGQQSPCSPMEVKEGKNWGRTLQFWLFVHIGEGRFPQCALERKR